MPPRSKPHRTRIAHGMGELGDLDAVPERDTNADAPDTKRKRKEDPKDPRKKPPPTSAPPPEVAPPTAEDQVFTSWASWRSVMKGLFRQDDYSAVKSALDEIAVWRQRERKTRAVPAYVSATAPLVEAMWADAAWNGCTSLDGKCDTKSSQASVPTIGLSLDVVCQVYGAAISRSLHIITGELQAGTAEAQGDTYRSRARALGVPEEMVEVRHRVAHGHDMPQLSELRLVCGIALTHFYNTYWLAQQRHLSALLREEKKVVADRKNTIETKKKAAATNVSMGTMAQQLAKMGYAEGSKKQGNDEEVEPELVLLDEGMEAPPPPPAEESADKGDGADEEAFSLEELEKLAAA